MIPERILQIAKTLVITSVVMTLCFYAYSSDLAIAFGLTSLWMLGNLVLLAITLRIALGNEDNKPVGLFFLAGTLKLAWLAGGIIALQKIGLANASQSLGVVLGIGSVLFVIVMKALGYKVSQSLAATTAKDEDKKVADV